MAEQPTISQSHLQLVKERYNVAKASSTLDLTRFAKFYKLFRNRQTTKNYNGLANLFVPEPYRVVRKKTAKLSRAIRKIKVTPEDKGDIQAAQAGSRLMNFLRGKLDWFVLERTAIQESRIVGLSWVKAVWLLDKEEEDAPYKGFDLSMETADRVYLAPKTTILDVFQGNIPYLVHEYDADLATLKKNPNYKQDQLAVMEKSGGSEGQQPSALAQSREMFNRGQQKDVSGKRKFNIKEYWGKIPTTNTDTNGNQVSAEYDGLVVVADDKWVLRDDKNPYAEILDNPIPFRPFVANPVGEELYPIGDIEPAESLFNELNDTRNQRMDTVTFNIDPPKEILKAAQIDKKQLVARRGWFFESAVPNGVRFIPPDMQGVAAAVNEEKIIRGDIQQVTGIIDFSQDTEVQAGISVDTARGAIVAKGEADEITEDELEILKVCLKGLYRLVLAYAQAFLDRPFAVRVVENGIEQFFNMTNADIKGNLNLDIEMKTLQDKTTEQSIKLMFLNIAKTTPGAKVGKFFTDALEAIYEDVNISEYYEEPPPAAPEPPKVSISLKGELTQLQASQVYATVPGVDKQMADPIMTQEGRALMRGQLPEYEQADDKQFERSLKVGGGQPPQAEIKTQ